MLPLRRELIALAVVFLTACGAMGQAKVVTGNGGGKKSLNAPLALGASVHPEVSVDARGDAASPLRLTSARPEVIAFERGRLCAKAPGIAPILISTPDGVVVDFYHLAVLRATRVALHRTDDVGNDLGELQEGVDLLVGESVYLTPLIYADAQELTGDVVAEWSAVPPIVDVLRRGVPSTRRLLARSVGEANLSVVVAGIDLKVPVRVLARPLSSRGEP